MSENLGNIQAVHYVQDSQSESVQISCQNIERNFKEYKLPSEQISILNIGRKPRYFPTDLVSGNIANIRSIEYLQDSQSKLEQITCNNIARKQT